MQLCPICSWNFRDNPYRTVSYPSVGKKSENKPKCVAFCGKCGVGIAGPLWTDDDIGKFYSEGEYWTNPKIEVLSAKKYPVPYALAISRWELIEPLLARSENPISILDVGAGHGFFGMVAAKSRKVHLLRYVCLEKDRTLVKSLEKTWSIHLPKITLEVKDHIDQIEGKFDCVILSHVLEHLPDPKSLLHIVLTKLKKSGFIFVDVPHQDYLFKKDVFPHLFFFNISSLKYLLQDCGLTIYSIDCYGNDMKRTPLNYKNVSKLTSILPKIIVRIRMIVPENFMLGFFSRYFGMAKRNNNGIWIRAIGQYSLIS